MTGSTDVRASDRGFSRRTLLRAGAHAAWSVPLIQVATASPAAASTGNQGTAKLTLTSGTTSWSGTGNNAVAILPVTVSNAADATAGTEGLQVTYTLPWTATLSAVPTGWSLPPGDTAATAKTTWVFTKNIQLAPGDPGALLSPSFKPTSNSNANKPVRASAVANSGPTGTQPVSTPVEIS